ncbi:PRC-barrel domain containing protein [Pusillimonas caeni]|uniref:PRC-barrel domain-containing protein n=1 Tax=Pusillimonas caeni TaxID=1348472 RepID=UPI000E59F2F4|nr:PRC-barrel domain-containing protein [Pusillimonas caeni]TFL13056.1 PRC-barrel domain containing protein [Pusillimonas caeni]
MTMKKKLAIVLCSMPFAVAPIAYAQTGGATEGTTSPQSGNQTDMGTDGAPNTGGTSGSGSSDTGSSSSPTTTPSTSSGASTSATDDAAAKPTPDASSGESFQAKLKGKSVYNENDEKVGDIKDLVMSSDGKVTHVILGVGGFVGVGEHPVAIPYEEIKESGDKLTLQGYTKDQLKEMPAYEYPKEEPAPAPASSPTSPSAPMGATR